MRRLKQNARRATLFSAVCTLLAFLLPVTSGQPLQARPAFDAGWKKGRETGFPVPRFVSLKAPTARMRVGPSTDYPITWVYNRRGLPLEITEEFGNWRRVRDQEGMSGWISASLLSGNRTAVIGPWLENAEPLHRAPSPNSSVIAHLEPSVRLNLSHCDGTWCRASLQTQNLGGFVQQGSLWGIYPGETLE